MGNQRLVEAGQQNGMLPPLMAFGVDFLLGVRLGRVKQEDE
jgi:hypothetical protein